MIAMFRWAESYMNTTNEIIMPFFVEGNRVHCFTVNTKIERAPILNTSMESRDFDYFYVPFEDQKKFKDLRQKIVSKIFDLQFNRR
jgi:hypothetical protein